MFTVVVRCSAACLAINGFSQEDEEDKTDREKERGEWRRRSGGGGRQRWPNIICCVPGAQQDACQISWRLSAVLNASGSGAHLRSAGKEEVQRKRSWDRRGAGGEEELRRKRS